MSNIYIQEPPTFGKVLLNTSVGDIDIELWSKETPKACRNFVQLCLEGYYDNTIFHRIVKGFCIQGGDPTGTGTGGESIYGQPFKDEIHQRLRFVRRGLVAMANAGKNDNQSQFFFTLGRADELNGKHTIFGKVTGNTIYNMLEMESLEVDKNDFPIYPPKIKSTEVLSNPFDDIIPREKLVEKDDKIEKKTKSKGTKNFSLLSFGEEAEDDETAVGSYPKDMKIKSSHDVLSDPKLSSVPAVEQPSAEAAEMERDRDGEHIADDVRSKLRRSTVKQETKESDDDTDDAEDKVSDRKTELMKESKRLQRELRAKNKIKTEHKDVEDEPKEEDDMVGAVKEFRQERKEFLRKSERIKKKGSGREEQTMDLLSSFVNKLENTEETEPEIFGEDDNEEDEDSGDISWMHHKLVFEDQQRTVKDANVRDEDTFEIFDPRNPINKRRREESKRRQQEKRKK